MRSLESSNPETESTMVAAGAGVAGAVGEKPGEIVFKVDRVSVWGDGKVPEVDGGDGCLCLSTSR